jgi:RNA polymerase sigma-54 factor
MSGLKDHGDHAAEESGKKYIRDKVQSATWLIKSIQQRQKTIYRVAESIVKFQRDFFDRGINFLKPLVLRDVADDVEMHESTISRVVTSKYMHTPRGIFELKYFFGSSIQRTFGENIASKSVKEEIKQLISKEDPKKPYSDCELVDLLKQKNIDIARRTVAKYREMTGILPSSKRKKYF